MAQITWKNIAAPSLAGATAASVAAGKQAMGVFDPLEKALTDAQAGQQKQFEFKTGQNTAELEAQLRGATSVEQLKQLSDPVALRERLGSAFDADAIAALAGEQEGAIRTQDITNLTNEFYKGREAGMPAADLMGALKEQAPPGTDIGQLTSALNAADDAQYKLTARGQEELTDYDASTTLERKRIESTNTRAISSAQSTFDRLSGVGISANTESQATSAPGGTLQYLRNIVDGKGQWFGDGDIGRVESKLNSLREITDKSGVQKYSETDLNQIALQAWNNTTEGKEDWLFGPHITDEVMDEMSRLSKQLPKQRAAADNLSLAKQNAETNLASFDTESLSYRQSLRDSIRSGSARPTRAKTDAQKIRGVGTPKPGPTAGIGNKDTVAVLDRAVAADARNVVPADALAMEEQLKAAVGAPPPRKGSKAIGLKKDAKALLTKHKDIFIKNATKSDPVVDLLIKAIKHRGAKTPESSVEVKKWLEQETSLKQLLK